MIPASSYDMIRSFKVYNQKDILDGNKISIFKDYFLSEKYYSVRKITYTYNLCPLLLPQVKRPPEIMCPTLKKNSKSHNKFQSNAFSNGRL